MFSKKPVVIHVAEEKRTSQNWQKIRFFVKNYDIAEHFKINGLHKTHVAKQDLSYLVESIGGYYVHTVVPLTGRGMVQMGCYGDSSLTIGQLFTLWKTKQIEESFNQWLNQRVFAEYMDKKSPLAEKIKPLKFYSPKERAQLKLTIKDGVIYQGQKPFDTHGRAFIFVQDIQGDFYASPLQIDGYDEVRHSSIFNGVPVKSAGMMQVHNGKIKMLSNLSGHYKPDLRHIYEAVTLLDKKECFDKEAKMVYYREVYDPELEMEVIKSQTNSVARFLELTKQFALKVRESKPVNGPRLR